MGGDFMLIRCLKKRLSVVEDDPSVYRKNLPENCLDVADLREVSYEKKVTLVGRIMLSDETGHISKFGVFDTLDEKKVIILEKIKSGYDSISAYLLRTSRNTETVNKKINYGDIVVLEGVKTRTDDGDIFLADDISLVSKAVGEIYNKNIDFSKNKNLYQHRHLQLLQDEEMLSRFRKCSTVLRLIREFLYEKEYEEINTTLLQKSFKGGLCKPFLTRSEDKDKDMFLRVTSEQQLQKLMIAGFSKVFQIGKSFRNQTATSSMLPQFTILELYQAYAEREEMEKMVKNMILEILDELYDSYSFPTSDGRMDCSGDWPVYDFREEVKKCTGLQYSEKSVAQLLSILDKMDIERPKKVNKYTIAVEIYCSIMSKIKGPAFLRNLPAAQSPLYKLNDDGSTIDETLLVIDGMLIADIVNPERDPEVLKRRMEKQLLYCDHNQKESINKDIISAMKLGLPPSRGIGMGIERLLMLLLNVKDIRGVDLFPVF